MDPDGGKNQAYLDGLYLSDYNLMKILDLVILNSGLAVMGCLKSEVIQGYQVWYWSQFDQIKGDCWALAEVCTQLSAIPAWIKFQQQFSILYNHITCILCNEWDMNKFLYLSTVLHYSEV